MIAFRFIIVPDKEVELFRSRIKDDGYKIIPETAVVPEFKLFKNYPGWNKQQLIKLAAAEIVETDFYLTLDADIICVRPTGFSDLVKDGRSGCFRLSRLEKSAEMFKRWYRNAEKVLKIEYAAYHHNVTPVVLSKDVHDILGGVDVVVLYTRQAPQCAVVPHPAGVIDQMLDPQGRIRYQVTGRTEWDDPAWLDQIRALKSLDPISTGFSAPNTSLPILLRYSSTPGTLRASQHRRLVLMPAQLF